MDPQQNPISTKPHMRQNTTRDETRHI